MAAAPCTKNKQEENILMSTGHVPCHGHKDLKVVFCKYLSKQCTKKDLSYATLNMCVGGRVFDGRGRRSMGKREKSVSLVKSQRALLHFTGRYGYLVDSCFGELMSTTPDSKSNLLAGACMSLLLVIVFIPTQNWGVPEWRATGSFLLLLFFLRNRAALKHRNLQQSLVALRYSVSRLIK